ncbi:hypothetical protein IF1G_11013 [Cordyceps javanica]|uniref:Uncharacterized protein n=1 Tax=Cordyceps javanica TaxID=43265 RepID=A0A545VJC8_9HYPO|nr:hypothetical protein IF1G_11013 [Cordyceps javanica]TQW01838.1 hypothetical protein IF2G_10686 [Cordyceps javanica]
MVAGRSTITLIDGGTVVLASDVGKGSEEICSLRFLRSISPFASACSRQDRTSPCECLYESASSPW